MNLIISVFVPFPNLETVSHHCLQLQAGSILLLLCVICELERSMVLQIGGVVLQISGMVLQIGVVVLQISGVVLQTSGVQERRKRGIYAHDALRHLPGDTTVGLLGVRVQIVDARHPVEDSCVP